MRKRLFCAVLALIMLFSAQSEAAASLQQSTVIDATCRLPVIRVSIPTSGSVYLNPFELPVSIDGRSEERQIVSSLGQIANESDVALDVDVTVTGAVTSGSTMSLADSPTGGVGSIKSAFVYFEIHQTDGLDYDLVDWDAEFDAVKHIVVTDGVPTTKRGIMTLPAMTKDGEVAPGGYALFRLSGDAVKYPEDDAWTSADGIVVTVAFTFTPVPYI